MALLVSIAAVDAGDGRLAAVNRITVAADLARTWPFLMLWNEQFSGWSELGFDET